MLFGRPIYSKCKRGISNTVDTIHTIMYLFRKWIIFKLTRVTYLIFKISLRWRITPVYASVLCMCVWVGEAGWYECVFTVCYMKTVDGIEWGKRRERNRKREMEDSTLNICVYAIIWLCIQMKSMECVYAHNCIIYLPWEMFQMKFRISFCVPTITTATATNKRQVEEFCARSASKRARARRNPTWNSAREMRL